MEKKWIGKAFRKDFVNYPPIPERSKSDRES